MQTVETQLAEGLKALKHHRPTKFKQVLSEIAGKPVEEQLSIVKGVVEESRRLIKVAKNNGADMSRPFLFDESDPNDVYNPANWTRAEEVTESDEVSRTAKEFGFSLREAAIFCGMPDPGKDAKFSAELQETLTEKWSGMRGLLSESDIKTLVAKGIQP